MTSKEMFSIFHVLSNTFSTKELFSFFGRITTSGSCCRLFARDHSMESVCDFDLADLTRDIQRHRLLGDIKSSQVSRFGAVTARLDAREEFYAIFTRVWRDLSEQDVRHAMTFHALLSCQGSSPRRVLHRSCRPLCAPACRQRPQLRHVPPGVLHSRLHHV